MIFVNPVWIFNKRIDILTISLSRIWFFSWSTCFERKQKKKDWEMFASPERYEMTRRFLSQTVGRTIRAVRIPKKWIGSRLLRPAQPKDVPGNSFVRLSPSKIMNSTQKDYVHHKRESLNCKNRQLKITKIKFKSFFKKKYHSHITPCTEWSAARPKTIN